MTQRPSFSERASDWLETVGAVALFAMMAITFVDIVGRFVLHRPLAGSIDLVQVLLLLTAGCTLPAVTLRGEHLAIGLFDGARPTPLERARRAVVALLVAAAFVALAVLLWRHGGETAGNEDVIGYLRIPVAPFVYAMAALCLVAGLAALVLVRRALRPGQPAAAPADASDAGASLEHTGAAT